MLQAVSLGAILLFPSEAVIYVASFTFGLSVGNAITLPALIVLDEFAPASFGLVIGLSTACNQFLYAFGPVLLGALRDGSGSYTVPLLACVGLELAAAALALAGRPGPTPAVP